MSEVTVNPKVPYLVPMSTIPPFTAFTTSAELNTHFYISGPTGYASDPAKVSTHRGACRMKLSGPLENTLMDVPLSAEVVPLNLEFRPSLEG